MESQSYIQQIDALKKMLESLPKMTKEQQEKLWKKFRLEWNYNSNHIEGNTLTYGQTELLLIFDKATGEKDLREYEEMKSHDLAIIMVEQEAKDKDRPLTENFIRLLNEKILVRPFWKEAETADGQKTRREIQIGQYKSMPNSVRLSNGEMFHYASPQETPALMHDLVDWYNAQKDFHPVTLAALFHYRFVRIHPFDDGNGRVARLLMNYILLKHDFPPVIIKSDDKSNYLLALNKADTGDLAAFCDYVAGQMMWSLDISIRAAKGESVDEAGDLDKKISLLHRQLETIPSEDEVQLKLSKEVVQTMYSDWIFDLLSKMVSTIKKFNSFFLDPEHSINIFSSFIPFVNQSEQEIFEKVNEAILNIDNSLNYPNSRIAIRTFYGAFRKGGLNTFGCNYGLEIKFDTVKYEVFIDEFSEDQDKTPLLKYTRLLHKPLLASETDELVKEFGVTIYTHIETNSRKKGII
jgi:Fic family protein